MSNSRRNWIIVGMTALVYAGVLTVQTFYSRKLVKDSLKVKYF